MVINPLPDVVSFPFLSLLTFCFTGAYTVKVLYQENTLKVRLNKLSLDELRGEVSFRIDRPSSSLFFSYDDADGDNIVISKNMDLQQAFDELTIFRIRCVSRLSSDIAPAKSKSEIEESLDKAVLAKGKFKKDGSLSEASTVDFESSAAHSSFKGKGREPAWSSSSSSVFEKAALSSPVRDEIEYLKGEIHTLHRMKVTFAV